MDKFLSRLFYRLLYLGSSKLREYEVCCLNCLLQYLSKEQGEILNAQIKSINLVQRFSTDKLVVFHFSELDMPLFRNQADELNSARATINSKTSSVFCDFVFHKGRISSLEFNKPPKSLDDGFECSKVEIYEDLSISVPYDVLKRYDGILDILARKYQIKDALVAASDIDIIKFTERLNTHLPQDYLKLLRVCNGFSIQNWHFPGTNARRIVRENSNCYLLLESEEQSLCVFENQTFPKIFLLDFINDNTEEVSNSFLNALEQTLS